MIEKCCYQPIFDRINYYYYWKLEIQTEIFENPTKNHGKLGAKIAIYFVHKPSDRQLSAQRTVRPSAQCHRIIMIIWNLYYKSFGIQIGNGSKYWIEPIGLIENSIKYYTFSVVIGFFFIQIMIQYQILIWICIYALVRHIKWVLIEP